MRLGAPCLEESYFRLTRKAQLGRLNEGASGDLGIHGRTPWADLVLIAEQSVDCVLKDLQS
jgi:hypothetical protein